MIYVYFCNTKEKDGYLQKILLRHTTPPFEILRTLSGKPYINGNPVYFNLSHSGDICAIAVSDSPVGIDIELYGRGLRKRVLSRFCKEEQNEIISEKDFLLHWTAREAYIKYCGGTLAHMLELTSFYGGTLRYGGKPADIQPRLFADVKYTLAVCGTGEIKFE
ncbi:MAG: 4'-phosphopantetheinyl transferase superfamily protein [Clostridia bacterium]|nr:4'-phosphopantetheinyl transferase superfamily protein [Clostridia bacterium]